MSTILNPYLNFRDNAREAMEFYESVFGGKLDIRTFKDFGMPQEPGKENLVMHSVLTADNGIVLMAADEPAQGEHNPEAHVRIALSGDNETELRGYFDKLSTGGTVTVPLEKAQWGDTFGMLDDKFGITWFVNITSPNTPANQ